MIHSIILVYLIEISVTRTQTKRNIKKKMGLKISDRKVGDTIAFDLSVWSLYISSSFSLLSFPTIYIYNILGDVIQENQYYFGSILHPVDDWEILHLEGNTTLMSGYNF